MKKLHIILYLLFPVHIFSQDTVPPEIVSFELFPQAIDVTDGPQIVTFIVGATDDMSGVDNILIWIELPDGSFELAGNETLISGTIQDGVWELSESFTEFTDPGIAIINQITFVDLAGNNISYGYNDLLNLGFDLDFEIINNNIADTTPPEIASFVLSPQVIDVTDGTQIVTFTVGATDDMSGVDNILIWIELPDGSFELAGNETLISGTIQDGVWELSESFTEFTDPGIATINQITFVDLEGNNISYGYNDLLNLGFDLDFEIINNNIADTTPPEIASFVLSPQIIDVTDGTQIVTFTVGATDDMSGVDNILIWIELPDGSFELAGNETLISGTIQDGVWELSESFNEFTDPGIAIINQITFVDLAGNNNSYGYDDLLNIGLDLDFEIINNYTLPVEWYHPLKIENKNKLTWTISHQINNSHFEIEHSKNGTEFIRLDTLKGGGNSTSKVSYEYFLKPPYVGINYYRIKQVDFDGKYDYSNIVSIFFKNDNVYTFPNPVFDRLYVNYPRRGKVMIFNQLGKIVKQLRLDQDLTEIELSDIAKGIYTLKFENGSTTRFVKN